MACGLVRSPQPPLSHMARIHACIRTYACAWQAEPEGWTSLFDWVEACDYGGSAHGANEAEVGEAEEGDVEVQGEADGRGVGSFHPVPSVVPLRPVQPVWEPTEAQPAGEGRAWTATHLPDYDECFQF